MYDTHTAYPMLAMFRSRQPGQHWLTGLAVVMRLSAFILMCIGVQIMWNGLDTSFGISKPRG